MIENTIRNFVPELHRILEEEPQSYTARIINNALPNQSLYPEQVEHLYLELRHILDAEYEFLGNEEIIKNFLKDFPFDKVARANQGDEQFFVNRYVLNFRQNYLEPKLYLIDEQTLQDLQARGLTAVSAQEASNNSVEIESQDQAGNLFTAFYDDSGLLSLEPAIYQERSFNLPESLSGPSTASFENVETTETTETTTTEQSISREEASLTAVAVEAEEHLQMQLEEYRDNGIREYASTNETETQSDQTTQARLTAEQEVESLEQNRQDYILQETRRKQQLQLEREQQQEINNRQRMSKSSKRIAIAAGAGATIFSGGIAGIVVLGDLIGLFA